MATNQNQKCRLCLKPGLFHMNLFTTSPNTVSAIREIFQCEVEEYDQLPNYICVDCWCLLTKFHEFYRKVIDAQNRFLQNTGAAIKVEVIHEYPVPINNSVEEFSYDCPNYTTYNNIEQRSDHHGNNVLYSYIKTDVTHHTVDDTSDFETNGFDATDDTNSCYAGSSQLFNDSDIPADHLQSKRKRGRPRKDPNLSKLALNNDVQPKRGRGRPKKIQLPDDQMNLNVQVNNASTVSQVKRKRGRPKRFQDANDETHQSWLEEDTMDMVYNDSDPNFKNENQSENDHYDDDDHYHHNDDDIDVVGNGDSADEYPPGRAYKYESGILPPKRARGRPRKYPRIIFETSHDPSLKSKRPNWRDAKVFKCPYCVRKFTRNHRVHVHIKLRHGFECSICNIKLHSEQKLKQHSMVHEEGFEEKLRQSLDEISSRDLSDVSAEERESIWMKFDRSCDNCSVQFETLQEAQVHYLNEHNNSRGYLKCCDMKLREDVIIKEHIAYHKNPSNYVCFVCGVTVKVRSYFRNHMKYHITELLDGPKHTCGLCNKHFTTKCNLQYHMAEVHAKLRIKCDICSKTLFSEAQKAKHTRNAHGTMSQEMVEYVQYNFDMSCDRCDEIFESLPHAIRHYSSEHSEPKGYIKCCNKKFRTLATIDDHIHWHKNPESWKCPVCHKTFQEKYNYNTHIRRHGKTFTCEICGKSFKRHTTLVGHRKAVHESGPRDFSCRFCSLRFLTDEKREGHEQLIHYGNSTSARIVCDICGKGFNQASHLYKHIQSHHSDNPDKQAKKDENKSEMCTICGLWLSSRYRLKLHRKCHSMEPNKCTICGLEAPNHDALLGHIRAFHEVRNKNKCRLCHETFETANELHEHAASHSNEKLYKCAYCEDTFVWRASLDAHMKKLHPLEWDAGKAVETTDTVHKLEPFISEQCSIDE